MKWLIENFENFTFARRTALVVGQCGNLRLRVGAVEGEGTVEQAVAHPHARLTVTGLAVGPAGEPALAVLALLFAAIAAAFLALTLLNSTGGFGG